MVCGIIFSLGGLGLIFFPKAILSHTIIKDLIKSLTFLYSTTNPLRLNQTIIYHSRIAYGPIMLAIGIILLRLSVN